MGQCDATPETGRFWLIYLHEWLIFMANTLPSLPKKNPCKYHKKKDKPIPGVSKKNCENTRAQKTFGGKVMFRSLLSQLGKLHHLL